MDEFWAEIKRLGLRWERRTWHDYTEFDLLRKEEEVLIARARIAGIRLALEYDEATNVYRMYPEVV